MMKSTKCRPNVNASLCSSRSSSHLLVHVIAASSLLLLLLLLFLPHGAHGFAAWLVTKPSGCWTDLDPSDVIMNANPKPPSRSDHPGVVLKVYDARTDVEVVAENHETNAGAGIVSLPQAGLGEDGHAKLCRYRLKLHVPTESRSALADVQYVVTTNAATDVDVGEGAVGTFTGPTSGCEGNRAYGRGWDGEGVLFQIDSDLLLAAENKRVQRGGGEEDERGSGKGGALQVWAGWATDHAAVQLTERVSFRLASLDDGPGDGMTERMAKGGGDGGDGGNNGGDGGHGGASVTEKNAEVGPQPLDRATATTAAVISNMGDHPLPIAHDGSQGHENEASTSTLTLTPTSTTARNKGNENEKDRAAEIMAKFNLLAATHGHHGANDLSREDIIRNQMGLKHVNEEMIQENVKKVAELLKVQMQKQQEEEEQQQRQRQRQQQQHKKQQRSRKGLDIPEGLQKEWDTEKVQEGLKQMANERAMAMKKKRNDAKKRKRYGPGMEKKKKKIREKWSDDSSSNNDDDDNDDNDDEYVSSGAYRETRGDKKQTSAVSRFRIRYERKDFGGVASFHLKGYLIGTLIMSMFVVGTMRYAKTSDRRWNKGARIL